jgi:hypothetical protein
MISTTSNRFKQLGNNVQHDIIAKASPPQFGCSICLFQSSGSDRKVSFAQCSAGHTFCWDCVKAYASVLIASNAVEIKCPEQLCVSHATIDEVRLLVSNDEFEQHLVSRHQLGPRCRDCESCGQQQLRFDPRYERMTCQCGVTSCVLHGSLHSMSDSCGEYVQHIARQEMASIEMINNTTKKMSHMQRMYWERRRMWLHVEISHVDWYTTRLTTLFVLTPLDMHLLRELLGLVQRGGVH